MDEPTKEEIEEVDGRTVLGKRLKDLEGNQKEIQKTLDEHRRRIDECSVRR